MPGRRPLTPDRLAEIALDADAGNLAIALSKRQVTEQQAVAQLALDAPCRPDLINSVATDVERCRATRLADWPPAETTVMLLRRAQQVTLGRVKLVGRDGVSVEQVTLTGKQGGPPIRYLQLRHHGQHVGDYRTVEELARHIDLATLVEELPPPEHRRQRAGAGARLPSSGVSSPPPLCSHANTQVVGEPACSGCLASLPHHE